MKNTCHFIAIFLFLLFFSCKPKETPKNSKEIQQNSSEISYNFQQGKLVDLPKRLKEISGLGYDETTGNLLCNNDEKGIIFEINKETGEIASEISFTDRGDFEGIEKVGNNVAILNSVGELYFYDLATKKTEIVNNLFPNKMNLEGICYDPTENQLLLVNKNLDENDETHTVYSYDIKSKKIAERPFLEITKEQIVAKVKDLFQKMPEDDFKELHKKIKKFAPSGIAINPKNNDIYIVSARGNTLVILNEQKQLQNIIFLDENMLPQPEGICFDAQNNLYISSEGKDAEGKLVKYVPQNN